MEIVNNSGLPVQVRVRMSRAAARRQAVAESRMYREPGLGWAVEARPGGVGHGLSYSDARRRLSNWRAAREEELTGGGKAPAGVAALALLLLGLLFPLRASALAPSYLAQAPAELRLGQIVCSSGFVESTRRERDGDLHVWLCEEPGRYRQDQRRGECILGEIVPGRPMPRPRVGSRVEMCGFWGQPRTGPNGSETRALLDLEHGWPELHPVTSIREVRP